MKLDDTKTVVIELDKSESEEFVKDLPSYSDVRWGLKEGGVKKTQGCRD